MRAAASSRASSGPPAYTATDCALSREGTAGVWGVWGEMGFPGDDDGDMDVPATIGGTLDS